MSWRIFLFLLFSWCLIGLLLLLPIQVLYQTFHYSWILLSQDHGFLYPVYLFAPPTLSYSICNQGIFEYFSWCILIVLKSLPRCVWWEWFPATSAIVMVVYQINFACTLRISNWVIKLWSIFDVLYFKIALFWFLFLSLFLLITAILSYELSSSSPLSQIWSCRTIRELDLRLEGSSREKMLFTKRTVFLFLFEIESNHYTFFEIVVETKLF